MKIAIDLDGVIFDTETYFRVNAQLYDMSIGGTGEKRREEAMAQKRYDWTPEQCNEFFGKNVDSVLTNAPIMPLAAQIIRALAKKHELYIITSRGKMSTNELDITHKRLQTEGIDVFTQIIPYDSRSKLEHCMDLGIDLMIDDLYDNVLTISNAGIPCLYFMDMVYKPIKNPLVYEVRNWGDIARYLVENNILNLKEVGV